jgi:LPXTG-motif cell wall-anchored protein
MHMSEDRAPSRGIPARVWVGLILLVLVMVFIAVNREVTAISFVFGTAQAPLWLALGLSTLAGFVAGFLFARRRR